MFTIGIGVICGIGLAVAAVWLAVERVQYARAIRAAEPTRLFGEEGATLMRQLATGELAGLVARLEALPRGAWSERTFLLDTFAPLADRAALDAWVMREPNNGLPLLLRGRHSVQWAWDARGRGLSETVSDEGAQLFFERLELAGADLEKAGELLPDDPSPHAFQIIVAMGLNAPREVAQAHFEATAARDPGNVVGHLRMLTFLAEKWHGSHEEMFAFAREAAAKAPPGSPLAALVLAAHTERWLYPIAFDDDAEAAQAWVADPAVREEVVAAWERAFGSAGPGDAPVPSSLTLLNHAGFWFFQFRDRPRTRTVVDRLGGAVTELPWAWLSVRDGYATVSRWARQAD